MNENIIEVEGLEIEKSQKDKKKIKNEKWSYLEINPNEVRIEIVSYCESKEIPKYIIYIIRIYKNNKSWLVYKRYSEFYKLFLKLKEKGYSKLSNLPPKIQISQLWENTPEKRKLGLQTFIDGLTLEKEILKEEESISFFNLKNDNLIYKLNDNIFRKIFRFLSFNDLFKNINLVCLWFKRILYDSFINIDINIIKKLVYFQNNIIKLDSMDDFNLLLKNFKNSRHLKIINLDSLNDKIWNDLSKDYHKLKSIHLIKSSLVHPKFSSKKLLKLDLSFSKLLNSIKLNSYSEQSLIYLNLSNTNINDSNLKILGNLKSLKKLYLKECENLKNPILLGDEIEEIYLDFCCSLTKPEFLLKKCVKISLNFTPINDECLIFENDNLKILFLNGCENLLIPKITFHNLTELYLSFCPSINNKNIMDIFNKREDDIILDCKNLKKVDIRKTNLNIEKIKEKSKYLKEIYI